MMKTVPNGWKIQKLGECVDILDSKRVPLNNEERAERIEGKDISELYPYYGATQQVGYIDDYIFDEELVLLGEDGVLFYDKDKIKSYIVDGKFWVNNHAHVLRAKNGVINKYLNYYLNTFDYHGYVSGTTRLKLTQANMKSIPVVIPPLPQQEKIVTVLDTASQLVEKQKALIEKYDLFLKSKFIEMFGDPVLNPMGWEVGNLESTIIDLQNGLYKPASEYHETGTPILRIDGFYDGKVLNWEKLKRVVVNDKEKNHYALSNGDIVINRVNSLEYLGKNAYIEGLNKATVYESNMMRIRMNKERINPLFLSKVLTLDYTYQQIMQKAKKAVNQASINQQDVKSIVIFIPPLQLQNQFAKIVEQTEQLKQKEQQKLEKLQTLYDALMQQAFNGEIV